MDNATYMLVWAKGPPYSIIGWDGTVPAAPMGVLEGCIVSAYGVATGVNGRGTSWPTNLGIPGSTVGTVAAPVSTLMGDCFLPLR